MSKSQGRWRGGTTKSWRISKTNRSTTTMSTTTPNAQSLQPNTYTRHFDVQPGAFTKKPVYHKQVRDAEIRD